MQSRHSRKRGDARLNPRAHGLAMAAFVDNSSLDVSENNSMAITLNIHIKSHTVCGRPTLSVLGTGRSANFTRDQFTMILYQWTFYREISSETRCTCKHKRVFRRDREPRSYSETSQKRGRKLKEFVYERIRLSIPKFSWLRRYVKVRRVTNKVAQHDKNYLLNCFEDAVLPQNRQKFAILILWVPASAISIPRNTSITAVNMAAVTNNTSQIKIPPCTFFTDRAQH